MQGRLVDLPDGRFVVGRDKTCDLRPTSDGVSRRHCAFRISGDVVLLRDLQSTNGTIVNGRPIEEEVELQDGDVIEFGSLQFAYLAVPEESSVEHAPAAPTSAAVGEPVASPAVAEEPVPPRRPAAVAPMPAPKPRIAVTPPAETAVTREFSQLDEAADGDEEPEDDDTAWMVLVDELLEEPERVDAAG